MYVYAMSLLFSSQHVHFRKAGEKLLRDLSTFDVCVCVCVFIRHFPREKKPSLSLKTQHKGWSHFINQEESLVVFCSHTPVSFITTFTSINTWGLVSPTCTQSAEGMQRPCYVLGCVMLGTTLQISLDLYTGVRWALCQLWDNRWP